jgi:formate/nitrite transporter FocA (FNT family)
MAASKNAGEILKAVVEDGREELDRASLGLAFSGFAAGLNISFSAVALAVVGALTGGVGLAPPTWPTLWASSSSSWARRSSTPRTP